MTASPAEAGEVTESYRWWLRLQVGLTTGGAAAAVAGMALEEPFFVGAGLGLFVGALALRLGRRSAPDSPASREES